MNDALAGLVGLLTPTTLLLVFVGTVAGMAIGAMPGLSATMGLALLVPFTFALEPGPGLVLLGAFYMGAIYGGSFTAILINAPGTPSSIATAFEGYRMTKQGRSEEAIIAATIGSVVGGLVGVVFLLLFAPPLASFSLRFGPQEYFWVAVFGLTIIVGMSTGSILKGLIGGGIGVLLGTVGIAPVGGDVRFTYDIPDLQGGVPLVPALIGLFTIPEVIKLVARRSRGFEPQRADARETRNWWGMTLDLARKPVNLLRSSVIGAFIGILPGAGGSVANLVAYNEAKRASKQRDQYGHGAVEGVVAAESANNATVGGGFIPTLTLGVPGTPPDAIVLGVLLLQGMRPGAELFTESGDLVYTFAFALALSALMMAPVGLIGGRALQRGVMVIPVRYLAPAIAVTSVVGAYAIRSSMIDVFIMLVLGVMAYFLGRGGVDVAPIVLGLVLGPIAERGLVQGLLVSTDHALPWTTFFTRPISIALIIMTILGFAWPLFQRRKHEESLDEMSAEAESDRT